MPSNVPARVLKVYMVGAGLSSAFRIPNTPSLLNDLVEFAGSPTGRWLADARLKPRLEESYKFFYPDADHVGFRPDPVDYFSALRTFIDIGRDFTGTGFDDAADLYKMLKRGIAHLLITRGRAFDEATFKTHSYLSEMVQPGNVIITSNWDTMIERFAYLNDIPLRLTSSSRKFSGTEVALLKLHGSVDWCRLEDRNPTHPATDFAHLRELQNPTGSPYTIALPSGPRDLIRVRSGANDTWQKIKARSRDHWMVTMVTGKADDLGPLQDVWRDAYRALTRAASLEVVGYSMPPDDVEIRSLLRAGIRRGIPKLLVRNPAPDVHYRVRAFLDRRAASDYQPVPNQ